MAGTAAGQDQTIADTFELALAPTDTAPNQARAEVTTWLELQGHDGDLVDAVRLLVSELVTNSVRHARLTTGLPLRLTATLRRATLRLEVRDQGTGGTVARRSPQPQCTTGYGLNLVEQLSRAWRVERNTDGTTVWLELAAAAHH